ncbi:MAG: DPP IV N-terminal domain-containing protein, partial [Gemmatimonadales bacterium]
LVPVQWSNDPRYFTVLEQNGINADLYRIDARSGERDLLVRGADLIPAGGGNPIAIESYQFSPDGSKLLIFTNPVRVWRQNTKGVFYVWDFRRRELTPVSATPGLQQFAKFSPDNRSVGFVRDHNIFVTDIRSGRERQLTFDGDENVINGTTDWVYEEELGLRDAFRFSPDSRRIAFWRLDQTVIKPFYLIDNLELYPQLLPVRYPKAGQQNSDVRIGVVEISSGETTWIDLGPDKDIYISRMDFAASSDEVWLTRLNRHQNRLDVMLADVRSGLSRVTVTDTDPAWVDPTEPYWIDGGRRFLLASERDGYNQLFLFNRDGSLRNKITTGEWDVSSVYGIDERNDVVYFGGAGEGPLKNPLFRVGVDGEDLARVPQRGRSSNSHHIRQHGVDGQDPIAQPGDSRVHQSARGERRRFERIHNPAS